MALFRVALAALALCLGVSAKTTRAPYGYQVYTQAYLRSVRKLSAQDSSFIVEGQVSYAYRQDGLWYAYNDGDDFPGSTVGTAVVSDGTDIIDSTRNAATWLGAGSKFKFEPNFPSQFTKYYSTISWTVNYGVPAFTGLNDTSISPADSGTAASDWLFTSLAPNVRNPYATLIGTCTVAAAMTAAKSMTCSSLVVTDGNGNVQAGGTLLPQMTCAVGTTAPPANPLGTNPGFILQGGSGLVWTLASAQTIAAGATVTCSLVGVPPVQVWVVGTQRFGGLFLQSQQLQDFPFDTQNAGFAIEASDGTALLTAPDVTFVVPSAGSSTLVPQNGVEGWSTLSSAATATSREDKNLGSTFAQATFAIRLARNPAFFVSRFVVPLCLIILFVIGSILFSPTGGSAGPHFMIPTAGFGMTISFLFVAAAQVPVLPYSTRLDKFFLLCFFTCFTIYFYNVATHLRVERYIKFFAEARTRNKGRLQWLWATPLPPALQVRDPPAEAAAVAVTQAEAPKAAAPAKAPHFWGVLSESTQDVWDVRAFLLFSSAFIVGASVILAGPSATVAST